MIVKKILPLLLVLILMAGCSGTDSSGSDLDPADAAQSLVDSVTFRDTLVAADAGVAESIYGLNDKVDSYAIYVSGSGATAEEVAVLKMKDAADVNEGLAILEKRQADLVFQFESYVPDELQKIQNPVLVVKGPVVIMVLADDFQQAEDAANGL